ncbi:tropomyosin [Trametes meyenii]|nr:tropomyosin [Trametes meyenii]
MEKIKERLTSLRNEQQLLEKDQEVISLQHKLAVKEAEQDKIEGRLAELKAANDDSEYSKTTNEALTRKIQLLEEELDAADKNLKDAMDKLRQVDVKAEHFERQVTRLEQERDSWEKKYEESQEKYHKSKRELDELVSTMEGL